MGGIGGISDEGLYPRFANYIADERIAEMTARGCARIEKWNPTEYERELARESRSLAGQVCRALEPLADQLPRQLAHGDFWDNNVLFLGGRIVGLIDFDFMGRRKRIDDLALTLYFINHWLSFSPNHSEANASAQGRTGGQREAMSIGRARELSRLADLYGTGHAAPLTGAERAALPIALALQPLWSVGGWIALLDDERAARAHASDMLWAVRWGRHIMDHLGEWQDAFLNPCPKNPSFDEIRTESD